MICSGSKVGSGMRGADPCRNAAAVFADIRKRVPHSDKFHAGEPQHSRRIAFHTGPRQFAEPLIALHLVQAREQRHGELHEFELDREALPFFAAEGSVPLPPYVAREAEPADRERYQTVYAERPGAVAAPTAGLHFDQEILKEIQSKGTSIATVTLHVGAGTFQPVRTESVEDHRMHEERYSVPEETLKAITGSHSPYWVMWSIRYSTASP